jgi:hypothetical protein
MITLLQSPPHPCPPAAPHPFPTFWLPPFRDIQLARIGPHTLEVTDPNGISIVVYESYPGFPWQRGICYVMLPCHTGSAAGIAQFYEGVLGAPVLPRLDKKQAEVVVGPGTTLMFRETGALGPRTDEVRRRALGGWLGGRGGGVLSLEQTREYTRNKAYSYAHGCSS